VLRSENRVWITDEKRLKQRNLSVRWKWKMELRRWLRVLCRGRLRRSCFDGSIR